MMLRQCNASLLCLVAAATFVIAGCGQTDSASDQRSSQVSDASHAGHDHASVDGHEHGGWWCVEHGIPEEDCAMCNTKLASALRKQGDWCEEHNRPDSQCFICHPEKAEKYAALYAAKYGKQPPKPTE
jgi:hypothetical protein